MHIKLSAEMQAYIKSKVDSGFYGNATEVIRDALRRMQAGEQPTARAVQGVAKATPPKV
jgi:antitoxin ParD1/3/4